MARISQLGNGAVITQLGLLALESTMGRAENLCALTSRTGEAGGSALEREVEEDRLYTPSIA